MTKTCKRCGIPYERINGIRRLRKDYGYCSIECITADKQPCPNCGNAIVRKPAEPPYAFVRRTYCRQTCAAVFQGSLPKTTHTKEKMSQAAQRRSPDYIARQTRARGKLYASEKGKQLISNLKANYARWHHEHPEAVAEAVRKRHQTCIDRGVYENTRQRQIAFFQSPQGEERKEYYRRLYTNKPRSPRVTRKMRKAIREFWDSPKGFRIREQKAANLTNNLDSAPSGPGWRQQASRARKRDGHRCVICGKTDPNPRKICVHHIYSRRQYGYIPGANQNYLWANHLANLITLCKPCHTRVHMDKLAVPNSHQTNADALWQKFGHQHQLETS